MFGISFFIHGIQNDSVGFDRLLVAVSSILVVGGLSYAIAPAWGPFTYGPGDNPEAAVTQRAMAAFQQEFRSSHGANYDPRHFVAALAAMPSLHLAHALAFLYFAWRHVPWLGIIYLLPVTFIASEAVAAGWHYLIDLPAGAAITAIGIMLAHRLVPPQRVSTPS
jgi:hypothetical protein